MAKKGSKPMDSKYEGPKGKKSGGKTMKPKRGGTCAGSC